MRTNLNKQINELTMTIHKYDQHFKTINKEIDWNYNKLEEGVGTEKAKKYMWKTLIVQKF